MIEGGGATGRFRNSGISQKNNTLSNTLDQNFTSAVVNPKASFADVVKKGVQSYSPFKVTVRHEEHQGD